MAENVLTLSEILKKMNKDQTHEVAKFGVEDLTKFGTLSLGSPGLDFCIYNSFPERKITEICGGEGSGKTTLAYLICGSFQKKQRKINPGKERKILWVDLECTADPSWASKMGYDMNASDVQTIGYRPEDATAEEIFDWIKAIVKTGEVGLVVIDSLSMLVSQQVLDESFEKKDMGGIAKVLGDFVKKMASLLIKYDCTLIGLNQLRDNLTGYGNPLITSGGRGWKHACSLRLMLRRGEFFDENYVTAKSTAESPAGYVMECAVLKSKVCKWDRKLGKTYVNYDRGIDILQDTVETAIHFKIIDASGAWFSLLDPDTGEIMLDAEGKPIKLNGKKKVRDYLEEHKDVWNKVYNKVYEKLSQKDDPNIVSFEKMLGMNVAETFGVDFTKVDDE